MHQQHVNRLIYTWVSAGKNMAVNGVRHSFLCNNRGLQIFGKRSDVINNVAHIMSKLKRFYDKNEISK